MKKLSHFLLKIVKKTVISLFVLSFIFFPYEYEVFFKIDFSGILLEVQETYAAGDGSIDSTVEINSSTNNGPNLADGDSYGFSVINIGDLDGDGV